MAPEIVEGAASLCEVGLQTDRRLEVLDLLLHPSSLAESEREVVMRDRVPRLDPDRLPILLDGSIDVESSRECGSQVVVRGSVLGKDPERLAIVLDRLVHPALVCQHNPEIELRLRAAWLQAHGLRQLRDRLRAPPVPEVIIA